ncbi:hypothetical protein DV736_g5035, partial [Chaetothyriales sp. CBS 134916]
MYLMDDDEYTALKKLNASITFTLSNGLSNNPETLNITLPYAAFDLETVPPINGKTFKYFPLNRSTDDTQYTLGRVILQEMYMVADYEHGNTSLWQGVYPNVSVSSDLVTICPLNSTTCKSQSGKKLSSGVIGGIVVGAALSTIVILAILGYLWWKKHRAPDKSRQLTSERDSVGTFGVVEKPELDASTPRSSPLSPRNDLDGYYASRGHKPELSGDSGYTSQSAPTASGSGSNPRDSRSVGVVAESNELGAAQIAEAGGREVQELGEGTHRPKRRSELTGSSRQRRYELPGSTSWTTPEP